MPQLQKGALTAIQLEVGVPRSHLSVVVVLCYRSVEFVRKHTYLCSCFSSDLNTFCSEILSSSLLSIKLSSHSKLGPQGSHEFHLYSLPYLVLYLGGAVVSAVSSAWNTLPFTIVLMLTCLESHLKRHPLKAFFTTPGSSFLRMINP